MSALRVLITRILRAERPLRLGVRTGSKGVPVESSAIGRIGVSHAYARVPAGKTSHPVPERMQTLEALLGPRGLVRVHPSIVDLSRVAEPYREGVGAARDGVRLRAVRGRWKALEGALGLPG